MSAEFTLSFSGLGAARAAAARIVRANRQACTCTLADVALAGSTEPLAAAALFAKGAGALVGQWITCSWGGAAVFSGVVVRASRSKTRGSTLGNTIVAKAGWYFLERVPYVQDWKALTGTATTVADIASSRVVLNQDPATGLELGAWDQIDDILACAKTLYPAGVDSWADETAGAGGTSLADVALPFDEMRDVTCAQALERVLRYFPDVSVAFDSALKKLCFRRGTAHDASAYVDAYANVLERIDEVSDDYADGVRVEISSTGTVNGTQYTHISTQLAGATTGTHVLNGTLDVAGRDVSRSKQRVDVVTEAFGDPASATWWLAKCPQVFGNAAAGDITITSHTRSGSADAANYPRITSTPVAEIEAAGLLARVETITCVATVARRDSGGAIIDTEVAMPVQIELITTNATTRTYTFTTALSATSAEPVPAGLAAALLAAHAGDGQAMSLVARLPEDPLDFDMAAGTHGWLPEPGDAYAGMLAQSVEIAWPLRTMIVAFGPPSHLSMQDMAGMMTGFRTRRTTSMAGKNRTTGEIAGDEINMNLAIPAAAVQSGQGRRERFVVKTTAGSVDLDPASITDADKEVKPRQITLYIPDGSGGFAPRKLWILGSAGVSDGAAVSPGGLPSGSETWGRVAYDAGYNKFVQYKQTWNPTTGVWDESATATDIIALDSHASQHM